MVPVPGSRGSCELAGLVSGAGSGARWPEAAAGPGWAFRGGPDVTAGLCLYQAPMVKPRVPQQQGTQS